MASSTSNCTSISASCPVEATVYGYYPNLAANAFFCAFFFTALLANLILGFRFKTWLFSSIVVLGCFAEAIGYVGRILLHGNPWSNTGFEMQICTLIMAPSFFAAAIYFTLKHVIRAVGAQFSPIKAVRYPWIFISCDIVSLVLQAIGGALAATANSDSGTALGGHIMLAGIVFQVATFTSLYILTAVYISNLRRKQSTLLPEARATLQERQFKVFIIAVFIASLAIYVRCIYRIAELAQGWANEVMRNEASFIVLDGLMCCIAILALTAGHPGIFFKSMAPKPTSEKEISYESSGNEV